MRLLAFFKREAVLTVAALCALATMVLVPPDAAYLGYIDLRVLCLLLCLMAVVAMAPRLLILDEAFAGLDAPTRMQLRRYLDLYQGAVLHISHDPADFAGYDAMFWLDGGRIRDAGTPDAVLAAYMNEMTRLGAEDDISDLSG